MTMLLRLLVATHIASAMSGCRQEGPTSADAGRSPSSDQSLTLGIAFETLQTEYWLAGYEAIKAEATQRGFKVLEAVADGDADRQFWQVKNFITRTRDGISRRSLKPNSHQ